jgi:serine/threonine protein phosphatase 1
VIRRGLSAFGARLTGRGTATEAGFPAPEAPVYVVGDIHGRADLLDTLLDRIAEDRAAQGWDRAITVFVGDYIDRGGDSAGVLARCRALAEGPDVVCLMGNHEVMCLDFLTGTGGDAPGMVDDLRAAALARIPAAVIDWLKARPLVWTSGDLAVCHATPDPLVPLADLSPRDLLWGRPKPGMPDRADGYWLVHGHTVVRAPQLAGRRVNVDTGAFDSNLLTAAVIAPGAPIRFLGTL